MANISEKLGAAGANPGPDPIKAVVAWSCIAMFGWHRFLHSKQIVFLRETYFKSFRIK